MGTSQDINDPGVGPASKDVVFDIRTSIEERPFRTLSIGIPKACADANQRIAITDKDAGRAPHEFRELVDQGLLAIDRLAPEEEQWDTLRCLAPDRGGPLLTHKE